MGVGVPILLVVLALVVFSPFSLSSTPIVLSKGSSLSVEKPGDVLISPNGTFSAGFYRVGDNAYCFAIWFSEPLYDGNHTIVWMANRDQPVNGKRSKMSLLRTGNLVLTDAGQLPVWATGTNSIFSVQLQLNDTGNLVLRTSNGEILWQSFDSPTDTLLPQQLLTKHTILVSWRSPTNYSSGFYKLYFDNDNLIRLLFDGLETSSVYWPNPWLRSWEAGRTSYDNSRTAVLDSSGHFKSSDDLKFSAVDLGTGPQRRLTVDVDGNVRLYSLDQMRKTWSVSWQAIHQPCTIHGICGPNSLCIYVHESGRRCSCIPGYKIKNPTDWSSGCEPDFKLSCNDSWSSFLQLPNVEFYGYDIGFFPNHTFEGCVKQCLNFCDCKGFQFKFDQGSGYSLCYPKSRLFNGYHSLGFNAPMYIRLPKGRVIVTPNDKPLQEFSLDCSSHFSKQLNRTYKKKQENGSLKFMLWFACAFGGVEIICIIYVLYRTRQPSGAAMQGYLQVATGFKKFTYAELQKASRNFSEEIGRGGSGVVYKGVLSDNRVAAIKRLKEANQGEAEFLAEINLIGRLNHINLIETWGYCAEGKHRLLVYEYMEHGSLAENLDSNTLDWKKRFEIAVGTAKGLAYLHEECLEWVLHCDVKPQNILLDSNYQPKVADFGLSKLLNRGGIDNSSFSRIRGTRGYMAPEWGFNLPITSKVDVFSYGVVMLEIITGKRFLEQIRLVTWVREKMHEAVEMASWIGEIIDPILDGDYDVSRMETLVKVAVQCAEENKDERPTMNQVVDMLLPQETHED